MALDRYAAGDYEAAVQMGPVHAQASTLAAFRKRFTREADAWIARDSGHREGRRFIAASYVLELTHDIRRAAPVWAEGDIPSFSARDAAQFEQVHRLFEWACGLLREDLPDAGERAWWLASVRAFPGALYAKRYPQAFDGSAFEPHVRHAVKRLPEEPQLQLAAALAGVNALYVVRRREEFTPLEASRIVRANEALQARLRLGGRWVSEAVSQADYSVQRRAETITELSGMRDALSSLRGIPDAEPEASLFLGAAAIAFAQHDAARRYLAEAEGRTADSYYIYLAAFLRGRIDEMDGRPVNAIAAYRRAVAAVPNANAATTALAALLWQAAQPKEARALVAGAQAVEPVPEDPWQTWGFPDWAEHGERLWAARLAELRQELDRERR